jgi:hypothetical protein
MATERIDFTSADSGQPAAQPELLVSAVLHLMSHYTAGSGEMNGRARLASVIERHLDELAERPDLAPVLRATCRQLSEQWAGIVERTLQPSLTREKQNLFRRLVGSVS